MYKVFISMPMKGKRIDEIRFLMSKAKEDIEKILGEPVELIDSIFDYEEGVSNPISFIGLAIQTMANADYLYCADGWSDARGCLVERIVAELYGIPVFEANAEEEDANG